MTAMNRAMVVAGIATLAGGQIVFTTLAILQYFCIIDFLIELPLLLFIKILYFHNPNVCGLRITIGQAVDGMPNQALVLLTQPPLTATRTLYINAVSLGLAVVWLLTCFGIMRGGAIKKESKPVRWPWLIVTVCVCGLDLVATVTYINDSFHTRTLTDIVDYAGGILSGSGNIEVNTSWVAWIMVILYSRFVFFFLLNLTLIVIVVIHVSTKRLVENTGIQVEAQTTTRDTGTLANMDMLEESTSQESAYPPLVSIPRPGLSHSFRWLKERLFRSMSSPVRLRAPVVAQVETGPDSMTGSAERLEKVVSEQQRRLDKAMAETGRDSPPRAPPPTQPSTSQDSRGWCGAAGLQGQLPWAYVPGAAHPMRDQLPPDEDLPPVPLPDYTVIPAYRKASVHRAASSLSSLTQKRDEKSQLPRRKYKSPSSGSRPGPRYGPRYGPPPGPRPDPHPGPCPCPCPRLGPCPAFRPDHGPAPRPIYRPAPRTIPHPVPVPVQVPVPVPIPVPVPVPIPQYSSISRPVPVTIPIPVTVSIPYHPVPSPSRLSTIHVYLNVGRCFVLTSLQPTRKLTLVK